MNFKVATKDVHTNLIVNLKKNEVININQFRFLQDISSKTGFLKPVWTNAGKTNKLCFDISGLMSLYQYLKTTISQDDYFEIVMKIQRCLDYCQQNHMLIDNLVCSSRNIYYNSVSGEIWFVYIPLNSQINKYNIIDFLINDIDKNAHIVISDISSLEGYRQKLNECKQIQKQNKSKNKNSFFSADKLYNILYELKILQHEKKSEQIPLSNDSAVESDDKYDISACSSDQRRDQNNMINKTVPVTDRNINTSYTIPVCISDERPEAFLVSRTGGKRIRIDNVPFFIGRTGQNDLVISGNEKISANHAVIDFKNGCYCIRDTGRDNKGSTNGTFVSEQRLKPMKEIKLRNGDTVSFYKDKYCFTVETDTDIWNDFCTDSSFDPANISPDANKIQKSNSKQGYIKNISDGKIYDIFSYPHVDQACAGICIEKEDDESIYIYNVSCNCLIIEDKKIEIGNRFEIFSGCSFSIGDSRFRFYYGG